MAVKQRRELPVLPGQPYAPLEPLEAPDDPYAPAPPGLVVVWHVTHLCGHTAGWSDPAIAVHASGWSCPWCGGERADKGFGHELPPADVYVLDSRSFPVPIGLSYRLGPDHENGCRCRQPFSYVRLPETDPCRAYPVERSALDEIGQHRDVSAVERRWLEIVHPCDHTIWWGWPREAPEELADGAESFVMSYLRHYPCPWCGGDRPELEGPSADDRSVVYDLAPADLSLAAVRELGEIDMSDA